MEKITLNSAIHLFSHLANITSCMAMLDSVDSKKLKEHRLCLQGSLGEKSRNQEKVSWEDTAQGFLLSAESGFKGNRGSSHY